MQFQNSDIAASAAPQWAYQHIVADSADKHRMPLAEAFRQHEQYAPLEAGFAAPRPMEDDEASVSSEWADEAPFDWEANHPATHGARSSLFDGLDVAGKKGQTFVLPSPAMPAARNIMDYAPDCKAPAPPCPVEEQPVRQTTPVKVVVTNAHVKTAAPCLEPVEEVVERKKVFCHEPYAPLSFADSRPTTPVTRPCPPPSNDSSLGFSTSTQVSSNDSSLTPTPLVDAPVPQHPTSITAHHATAPMPEVQLVQVVQAEPAPDAYTQAKSVKLDPAAPFNHHPPRKPIACRAPAPFLDMPQPPVYAAAPFDCDQPQPLQPGPTTARQMAKGFVPAQHQSVQPMQPMPQAATFVPPFAAVPVPPVVPVVHNSWHRSAAANANDANEEEIKRPKRGCRGGRVVQMRKQKAMYFAALEANMALGNGTTR